MHRHMLVSDIPQAVVWPSIYKMDVAHLVFSSWSSGMGWIRVLDQDFGLTYQFRILVCILGGVLVRVLYAGSGPRYCLLRLRVLLGCYQQLLPGYGCSHASSLIMGLHSSLGLRLGQGPAAGH